MRHSIFLLALLVQALAGVAQATVRVMITGFEPFGGSSVNRSDQVAEILASHPGLAGQDVEITYCQLPVVYDRAAETAQRCYESAREKPAIVLSLGEAPDCALRLETAAQNLDNTPGYPDNAGQERAKHAILPDGPASIGFSLPVQDMYCALEPSARNRVQLSRSPGNYVCNNTAYLLANYFAARPVQYGFVHVPNPGCGASSDPQANAGILGRMIRSVIQSDRLAVSARGPNVLPRCGSRTRLPASAAELDGILSALKGQPGSECYDEFALQLRLAY